MTYTPTEWECGDTITAEKLNKLENGLAECCGGGGSEPLIIRFTGETETIQNPMTGEITYDLVDKTPTEVFNALKGGRTVLVEIEDIGGVAYKFPASFADDDYVSFMDGDPYLLVLPSDKLGKEQEGGGA